MDAIHLPSTTTPVSGAASSPLPAPGQLVQALVLELIESDVFRLQLPQGSVKVRTDAPLAPGTAVMVLPKAGGANARLIIYPGDAAPAAPASAGSPAAGLGSRQPIGEATVIGRAAQTLPGASIQASAAGDAQPMSNVPDAPSLSPARAPEAAAPRNLTPQQALGEAVRAAAVRQTGLAPLLADAEQAVQLPRGMVPAPVRAAAAQVLALRVPLDTALTGADVKQAFVRSGVLLEPRLAAEGRAVTPMPAGARAAATPAPAGDLKAALIVFREVLKAWSAETAPVRVSQSPAATPANAGAVRTAFPDPAAIRQLASALAGETGLLPAADPLSPQQAASLPKSVAAVLSQHDRPAAQTPPNAGAPPPYRGGPLAAQQPAAATIPGMPPHEAAERLLGQADGALARTTLLQAASLPDQPVAHRPEQTAQRWTFEVPFMTPQGTAVAQFEVSRDGRSSRKDPQAAVWRARFSLDLEPMGPVHALVALTGGRASVSLWAERAATASRLKQSAALLGDALRAAELEPADFQFRVGTPPSAARQPPGRFMDRAT